MNNPYAEQLIFSSEIDGLSMEQIVREKEFSMASRHFHATYELYYLLEGERYYFIDNETYLVKAGDIVMIRPNRIHKTSMVNIPHHNRVLLQISGERMNPFLKAAGLGSMDDIYGTDVRILSLSEEQQKEVLNAFMAIKEELSKKRRHYQAAARMELANLLLKLSRYQSQESPLAENPTAQTWKHIKVHEVADYLTNHPETSESLEELAQRFYISKSYLSRIFREITGFSVNEYKNISRIKKSQNLLIHSDCSVTEISGLLGFENLTYYERVFKKYTEMTPLKYRGQMRLQG